MGESFDNLVPLFLSEAERLLGTMDEACETLEADPDDQDARDVLCRGAHTIKGSAAVMGLTDVADFSGVIERMLGCFKGEPLPFDQIGPRVVEAVGLAKQLVQEVAQGDGADQIANRARMAELAEGRE